MTPRRTALGVTQVEWRTDMVPPVLMFTYSYPRCFGSTQAKKKFTNILHNTFCSKV